MGHRVLTYGLLVAIFIAQRGAVAIAGEDRSTIPKVVKDVLKDAGIDNSKSSVQRKYDSRKPVVGYESESNRNDKMSADKVSKGLRSNSDRRNATRKIPTPQPRQRPTL